MLQQPGGNRPRTHMEGYNEEERKLMRSRSLKVPNLRSVKILHTHPYVVGQTGIIYQIFNKVGSGSFGIVYNVKIMRNEND